MDKDHSVPLVFFVVESAKTEKWHVKQGQLILLYGPRAVEESHQDLFPKMFPYTSGIIIRPCQLENLEASCLPITQRYGPGCVKAS